MNIKLPQPPPKSTPSVLIRPYAPSDRPALEHIFRTTADRDLRSDTDPRTLAYAAHIWCHPYPFLEPQCCFVVAVLDHDESESEPEPEAAASAVASSAAPGTAVGYILSTPSTAAFSSSYSARYLPTLDADITTPLAPGTDTTWRPGNLPNALLDKIQHAERWVDGIEADVPGVLARFPAHLHIDVLPEWQRMGFGRRLMGACLERLRQRGAKGCHLQMVQGNEAARAFYRAVGFTQWGDTGKAEWCMVVEL